MSRSERPLMYRAVTTSTDRGKRYVPKAPSVSPIDATSSYRHISVDASRPRGGMTDPTTSTFIKQNEDKLSTSPQYGSTWSGCRQHEHRAWTNMGEQQPMAKAFVSFQINLSYPRDVPELQ
ncbi:hypothetical protein ACTXT7_015798 [Hymenolepis weldensis]